MFLSSFEQYSHFCPFHPIQRMALSCRTRSPRKLSAFRSRNSPSSLRGKSRFFQAPFVSSSRHPASVGLGILDRRDQWGFEPRALPFPIRRDVAWLAAEECFLGTAPIPRSHLVYQVYKSPTLLVQPAVESDTAAISKTGKPRRLNRLPRFGVLLAR